MTKPKTGGRKSRYTSDLVEAICQTIRETGSDRLGYERNDVSHQTFYKWISLYPEFNENVEKARQDFLTFKQSQLGAQKELAESYIHNVLAGKAFRWSMREVLDRNGVVHQLSSVEQVLPTPQILERVLGQVKSDDQNTGNSFQVIFGLAEPPELEEGVDE
jgi:hypothetical protein